MTFIYFMLAVILVFGFLGFMELNYMSSLASIAANPFLTPRSLAVTAKPDIVLKSIIQFTHHDRYQIDYFDKQNGILLLSRPSFISSDGYSYRICVSTEENNQTLVKVEVVGKSLLFRRFKPGVEIFLARIESAVFAYD